MDESGCAPAEEAGFSAEFTRTGGDSVTVQLRGDLDIASVAAARRALEELDVGIRQVFLDLSRIAYCDAAGIRFLLTARKQARTTGRDLITWYPSRSVRRALAITGDLREIGRADPPTDEE